MRKISKKMKCKFLIPFVVAAFTALLSPPLASADAILGSNLASFAVLGASTVTNTGATTLTGTSALPANLGVFAGSAITGQETITINTLPALTTGSVFVHAGDAYAGLAQGELTTAINNLNSLVPGSTLAADLTLAGTLSPGVYRVLSGTTNLSGALTLNGGGNANALWVFQMDSDLITSPGSAVNVIGTGAGAGIFWDVRSSANIDTTTSFEGNILALTSIALKTGATIGCGRALASTGAVTMEGNTIGIGCESYGNSGGGLAFVPGTGVVDTTISGPGPGGGTVVAVGGPAPAAVPEPGTMMLLGSGLVGLVGWGRKKLRK